LFSISKLKTNKRQHVADAIAKAMRETGRGSEGERFADIERERTFFLS